jgi:hypothetical protein
MRRTGYVLGLIVAAVTSNLWAAVPTPSGTWRHVARFVLEPCEADLPSLAVCPRSRSPVLVIESKLWRIGLKRQGSRFLGVWSAVTPPKFVNHLREELADPARRDTIRTFYYPGPGKFFLFSSAIDIAIQVSVEQYR